MMWSGCGRAVSKTWRRGYGRGGRRERVMSSGSVLRPHGLFRKQ